MVRELIAAFVVALSLASCSDGSEGLVEAPGVTKDDVVITSFEPARFLAERLVGDLHPVICPTPADADPASWRPSRDDILAMQKAMLIVVAGADFEQWVDTASLPRNRVLRLAEGLRDPLIEFESTTHTHGAGGEHTHDGVDGHTWLDPIGLVEQSEHLLEALTNAWPDSANAFESNAVTLRRDLEDLHADYEAIAADMQAAWVLCAHPAYNYLARRYGWEPTNLDIDPDQPLATADYDGVAARVHPFRTTLLLWEADPLPETIAALDELGVHSVVVSPAERPSDEGDLIAVMRANLARLRAALDA